MKGRMLLQHFENKGLKISYEADSRKVEENGVFFALKGQKVDGHSFLKDVAEKKALAAVVSQDYQGDDYGMELIRVENVLKTLQQLAKEKLAKKKIKIIGVTGSVGKTTSKEFLATILAEKYSTAKTPGNANSQVGVPLSILNLKGDPEIFVVEMGMSLAGEIENLIAIAPPDFVLMQKVGMAHVESFSNGIRGVAEAKGEILMHPKTQFAVIHEEAMVYEKIANRGTCKKLTFGADKSDYILHHDKGNFRIEEKGQQSPSFTFPFEAFHLQENFLGAAAVARNLGLSWEEILAAIPKLRVYKNRYETFEKKGAIFINDCYNSNPESMRAVLKSLPKPKGGKTIGVIGYMVELGPDCERIHREIGELGLKVFDHLLCIGKKTLPMVAVFEKAGRPVAHFEDLESLKNKLNSLIEVGDVVLVKGSNPLQLWRLFDEAENPFKINSQPR